MLQSSGNFTATELRFLQKKANGWIVKTNALILDAAEKGRESITIAIPQNSDNRDDFYYAPNALLEHFRNRGFKIDAQMERLTINWEDADFQQ